MNQQMDSSLFRQPFTVKKLENSWRNPIVENPQGLSKRELEVMRRIAWGKVQRRWRIRWRSAN